MGRSAPQTAWDRPYKPRRKVHGLRQAEAAALCSVGTRDLSELGRGKATVELGKALAVLQGLGLEPRVAPREAGR